MIASGIAAANPFLNVMGRRSLRAIVHAARRQRSLGAKLVFSPATFPPSPVIYCTNAHLKGIQMSDLLNDYENNGFFHETPAAYLDDTGAMPGMAVPYSGTGLTRLLNAASTPFPVNLALDRVPRVAGSIFSSLTDYDAVPAGSHRVRLTQESPSNALLLEKELTFPPDVHSTAVLVDSAGQGVDLLQFMDQSCAPDTRDQACLRTVNVSMEDSSFALHTADGIPLHQQIPFGAATPYRTLPPGPYSFYVTEDSGYEWLSGPIATASLTVQPGQSYTLYLLGNTWSPYGFRIIPVKDA